MGPRSSCDFPMGCHHVTDTTSEWPGFARISWEITPPPLEGEHAVSIAEATETALPGMAVDSVLYKATQDAVNGALTMCERSARCVGVSSVPSQESGNVTGLIGVHGKVSGFVTVNLAERFALSAVGGLLGDNFDKLTSQTIDGVGEITNIIVGGIKSGLASSQYAFPHITVPSVIIGSGYQIAYSRGLEFLCVTFEHDDPEAVMLQDRLMQVSISLLRL